MGVEPDVLRVRGFLSGLLSCVCLGGVGGNVSEFRGGGLWSSRWREGGKTKMERCKPRLNVTR